MFTSSLRFIQMKASRGNATGLQAGEGGCIASMALHSHSDKVADGTCSSFIV